ncbi:VOC family protein [Actinocrispum sp. NPDC049592]|uniref:VOC family protein n=1 Tax=Actinocrispum sp. NPDC049592 TaxID=3154835 RepID=UPI00343688D8
MIGELQCVVLDCPDAVGLARFYQALVGGEVNRPDRRWGVSSVFATLHLDGGMVLTFQGVAGYRAPRWPDPGYPQQFHLDVEVADLDEAQRQVVALGGELLHVDARGWRVFADPAGHPFCLLKGASTTKPAVSP